MARFRTVQWLARLGVAGFAMGGTSKPAAAQCPYPRPDEYVVVHDPVGGCRMTTIVNGNPVERLRIRRGVKTGIFIARHFVDQARSALRPSVGTISDVAAPGWDGPEYFVANLLTTVMPHVGWLGFSLTLTDSDPLGNMNIYFPGIVLPGGLSSSFNLTLGVVRRGEITGVSQSPATARWGDTVLVKLAGKDINNASVQIAGHTIIGTVFNTNDTIRFKTKASSSTYINGPEVVVSTKDFADSPPKYIRPGQPVRLSYTLCSPVASLSAPQLSSPANGVELVFTSSQVPLFHPTWFRVPDPQQRYIVQLEKYASVAPTTTTLTGGKTTSSISLTPLSVTVDTTTTTFGDPTLAWIEKRLERDRTYKWKVRAYNCGQSAPFSTVRSFTVR